MFNQRPYSMGFFIAALPRYRNRPHPSISDLVLLIDRRTIMPPIA
jgi:hypothetical protein